MDEYSKNEVDSKLETSIDGKLDALRISMDAKFELILSLMNERFAAVDKRIDDLWKITLGVSIALFVAIGGLYLQNSTQKPEKIGPSIVINQVPQNQGK